MTSVRRAAALTSDLVEVVGRDHVLTDPDLRAGYETDWTGRYTGIAALVVRPATTAEVAEVIRRCSQHGAAIVTQGGNTGLVGGGVPRGGEVVLSTRRLTSLGTVDRAAAQVTAGAGVTIGDVQRHARASGLDFAVDWGARDSATVGGAVATNAGGSRVVRFGTMRSQLMGVEAVRADGSIVGSLHGLPKETVGMHLPSMLCGSEGTLAIITAARLALVPWYQHTAAAWVPVTSLDEALGVLRAARTIDGLDAVEILFADAVRITAEHLGVTPPVRTDAVAYVLVDIARHRDPSTDLADVLAGFDGMIGTGSQREQLINLRDSVSTAIGAHGVPLKLDVAVPVASLPAFVDEISDVIRREAPSARPVIFGHLAEGNLHVNVLHAGPAASVITEAVLSAAIDRGGTISAEHGVGVAKPAWLSRVRGEAEVALLRSVKRALDPTGMLNPGVLMADQENDRQVIV